jgi:MerR family transcriptional regulator, Zn(II)-responsive regulator of zntA
MTHATTPMTVGELARAAQVPAHVVRYYARIGLLHPTRHPYNGYKLFSPSESRRIQFIRQAQTLGFSLSEIADIFAQGAVGHSPCPRVRDILKQRIEANRKKLDELASLQSRMEAALEKWAAMPDGVPDGESVCHLIEST